ncbi:uncharacterized protein LOC123525100 [Mercenaria mercenaria]|uniref:uncharacterized protein LOC123525100 n=1 Tax=Mercenaria mercenaria TaxID=6596 RepID=UPI00234F88FA|nr:uncharacterized protein LOC123525100 [Mercenaria mercenaria]
MAVKINFQMLSVLYLFFVGSECRGINHIEKKVNILEQKFGIQTYENTLMKQEINNLKTTVREIAENITDWNITDKTNRNSDCDDKTVDMSEVNQKLSDVVQVTKSLLYAFNAEKQERIKVTAELETLRKTEQDAKTEVKTLKENLEVIQENLKTQEDMHREEMEQMQKKIDDITAYKETMEELLIEQKVLNNEKSISKLAIECDRAVNTMETKYESVVTSITGVAESLKLQQIAFSARLASHIENLDPWQTAVFNQVITNTGNAYSGQTGIFTSPVPGVYVFYTHILASDRNLEMCLQRNGRNVLWLYVNGKGHGGDSNMIVLHLNKGDEIKVVKHGPYGSRPFYVHHVWSTFSGYILYPTTG